MRGRNKRPRKRLFESRKSFLICGEVQKISIPNRRGASNLRERIVVAGVRTMIALSRPCAAARCAGAL
jgi:hypothetical protein